MTRFTLIIALLLASWFTPTLASAQDITFQVKFWDWNSLSATQQAKANVIMADESNFTAAFNPGAVSRDMGPELAADWRLGNTKSVQKCVSGSAVVPGMSGRQNFSACPGQNTHQPQDTFQAWRLSKASVLAQTDPQFGVRVTKPNGCRLVYWADKATKGESGYLSTRTRGENGENEILAILGRNPNARAINLNFLIAC